MFRDGDSFEVKPLAAFAAVRADDGVIDVVGLVADDRELRCVDLDDEFLAYVAPGTPAAEEFKRINNYSSRPTPTGPESEPVSNDNPTFEE